ncbi:hypothetical protein HYW29_01975 [Candidatus Amesbacteria bacterium]|nr:hypothetical protein [Candidatus Amesbacteria bacterium]
MTPDNKTILGDQSPWTGGILRYAAVAAEAAPHSVIYCIQDADAPWKQDGISDPTIRRGWVNYWSIAVKIPWTWSIPDLNLDNVRQTLGSPHGLLYLAGPDTSSTIRSQTSTPPVVTQTQTMLLTEVKWAEKVGQLTGNSESEYASRTWEEAIRAASTLDDLFTTVGSIHATHISSMIDMFAQSPPLLIDHLGPSYYWTIDSRGNRQKSRGQTEGVLVPKGKALPLELCARGLTIGFTGLPYMQELIALRNQKIPDLPLQFLQVSFDWILNTDPITAMLDEFRRKKKARGETVHINPQDVNLIKQYWQGRPTSISHHVLGGELHPSFQKTVI